MRLVSLRVDRLPGLEPGLVVERFAPGLNVITGPNASGKSSVLRALAALLYESEARGEGVEAQAVFEDGEVLWEARRTGDTLRWSVGGRESEAPALPDGRFLGCYLIGIEDLAAASDADAEIAKRIARELSGGYDLAAVASGERFRPRSTAGRGEREALRKARAELRAVQGELAELRERERDLARLRAARRDAAEAGRDAGLVREALALLEAVRRRTGHEEELAALPSGLELLRGDERDTLARVRSALGAAEAGARQAGAAEEESLRRLRESGLAQAAPSEGDLGEARAALDRLRVLEADGRAKRGELERIRSVRRHAELALGASESAGTVLVSPESVRRVEEQLARKRRLDARALQLEAELRVLPAGPTAARALGDLRAARQALLAWLSAAPEVPVARRVSGLFLASSAFFAAVALAVAAPESLAVTASVVPGLDEAPTGALPALLAASFLSGLGLLGTAAGRERRLQRRAFGRTGVEPPAAWRQEEVLRRLEELGIEIAQSEREDWGLRRRAELVAEAGDIEAGVEEVGRGLAELAREVGYHPDRLDASFERWLMLVRDLDRAQREEAGTASEVGRIDSEAEEVRAGLVRFLGAYGEPPSAPTAGADGLAARLSSLERRHAARVAALASLQAARRERAGHEREAKVRRGEATDLLERCGLAGAGQAEAEAELRRRLALLERYRELSAALGEERTRERELRRRLGERDDLIALAESDGEEELRSRLDALEAQAAKLEEYAAEIGAIEERLRRAGTERRLERLRALQQEAEDALRDRYDEALFAEAGRFLLERIEEEHEAAGRPEALQRAAEWFGRFTNHDYELRFASGRGSVSGAGTAATRNAEEGFRAFETGTGRVRTLAELSTGTKAQLLLAVRLAFAMQAERGRAALPVFLDEALTTSDPERFRAVARSLRTIAEEGRQVFYLTARAADLSFWEEEDGPSPALVDVGRLRETGSAVREPDLLKIPYRRLPPPPGQMSAHEYGVALAVPPIDPWSPAEAVHLFHLLRDDLENLHRLLCAGVERCGVLRSYLGSDAAPLLVDARWREEIGLRLVALDAWLEAWRHGRGRPLHRQALVESGAVTDTFLDRVDALRRELLNDAAALLESLEAGAVRGFRASAREGLAEWLFENGYVVDARTLDPAEVRQRVCGALARVSAAGEREQAGLLELAERLCGFLDAGVSAGRERRKPLTEMAVATRDDASRRG